MILTGTLTKKKDDGTKASCEWMIDLEKGELVQVGGEGELVAEDIDLIMEILNDAATGAIEGIIAHANESDEVEQTPEPEG